MAIRTEGILYIHIGVRLSTLLVSTDWAMREPLERGTGNRYSPHAFLFINLSGGGQEKVSTMNSTGNHYRSPDLNQQQIKSKERVSAHGEVFTAEREVNAMLDLVKQETERIDSRFLEPACGNGNFLAKILERKLAVVENGYAHSRVEYELNALLTIASLYGIELLSDNVEECKERLYAIFYQSYHQRFAKTEDVDYLQSIRYVLDRNILWGDALTLLTPDGKTPIVFSEWSAVQGMINRRDFTLDALLKNQPMEGPNLFSDLGTEAFIPEPIAEYPLIAYNKLYCHVDQSV
ncbi:SAM-dependent DNA methyltransferase [Parabacteroides sp.]